MKTREFIKRVKEFGYESSIEGCYLVISRDEKILMTIHKNERYKIDSSWTHLDDKGLMDESLLFDLAVEYARTPIDEREEEKKYRLLLPNDSHVQMIYVYRPINKVFYFNDIGVTDNKEQDEFTEQEIKALPNQTLVDILERVEVK